MSYKPDDTFVALLMHKINQVTPKHPTNGDWERFDNAYRLYRKNKRKRKIIIGLWVFVVVAAFSSTLMVLHTNNSAIQSNARVVIGKPSEQPYTATSAKKKQEKFVPKSIKTKEVKRNDKHLPSSVLAHQESGTRSKTITHLPEKNSTELKNEALNEKMFINDIFIEPATVIQPKHLEVLNIPNQKVSADVFFLSDLAFRSTAPSIETQNNIISPQHRKHYISIGAVTQNTLRMDSRYPAPLLSTGIGLTVGKFIHNRWSVNIGANALLTKQSYSENIQTQTIENHIEGIDTTLKYNSSFGRIMMQFDTLTTQKIIQNNQRYSYSNNVAMFHLPIQVRYHIGSDKRSMYLFTGVTGTLLHQTQTTTIQKQSVDNTENTTQTYRLGIAPIVGIGASQTVYKNWSLHLSSSYATYVKQSLGATNLWQLHTGITYQF